MNSKNKVIEPEIVDFSKPFVFNAGYRGYVRIPKGYFDNAYPKIVIKRKAKSHE